ncbi:hypothetical protein EYR36_000351 [Pleurotus pulmonarius]|nr:hypothetical protein EYR36_000351 [Pleurotus pulmonarius]
MVGLSQKLTEALEEMRKFMEQRNLDSTPVPILLVVIIPQNAADVRADVKYWDDVEHGESCFCCVRETKICIGGQLNIILTMSLSRALDQLKKDRYMIMAGIDDAWRAAKVQQTKLKLTFIVVSERHHIRFFPKFPHDADEKGNCPAGLVVDTGIQSPFCTDFYLLSHSGVLGTSRPSHYIILKDEISTGISMVFSR